MNPVRFNMLMDPIQVLVPHHPTYFMPTLSVTRRSNQRIEEDRETSLEGRIQDEGR